MSSSVKIQITPAQLLYDKKLLRQIMRTAGTEVAATARKMIRTSAAGGSYRKGRQASAPGQAPRNLSGQLARSIRVKVFRSGDGVAVRSSSTSARDWYALALEVGAANNARAGFSRAHRKRIGAPSGGFRVQPRPFLSAALASRAPSLGPRIAASLAQDIKLVRIKP